MSDVVKAKGDRRRRRVDNMFSRVCLGRFEMEFRRKILTRRDCRDRGTRKQNELFQFVNEKPNKNSYLRTDVYFRLTSNVKRNYFINDSALCINRVRIGDTKRRID